MQNKIKILTLYCAVLTLFTPLVGKLIGNVKEKEQQLELKEDELKLNNEEQSKLKKELKSTKEKLNTKRVIIVNLEEKVNELEEVKVASARSIPTSQVASSQNKTHKEVKKEETFDIFLATAYSTSENGDPHAGAQWGNRTAIGTTVEEGRTIAVDPSIIPLGSEVYIEFPSGFEYLNGTYKAEDTGGAIKNNEIDVYLDDYNEVLRFGKQKVKVRIVK